MLCPECRVPLLNGRCPQCGTFRPLEEGEKDQEETSPDPASRSEKSDPRSSIDWKEEVRRRLQDHRQGMLDLEQARRAQDELRKQRKEKDTPPQAAEKEKPIREDLHQDEGRVNPSDRMLEKPLIRMPSKARSRTGPRQQELNLEAAPSARVAEQAAGELEEETIHLSGEIVFSRFLSGIIDIALPVMIGFGFAFAASAILEFDFFMSDSLEWAAMLSLCFFFLNSLFFFLTSGQTPGMYLTELRLVGEKPGQEPSVLSIFVRVLLFVPVLCTIIGLLWILFDPMRRCLHDQLSRTRIEPLPHP